MLNTELNASLFQSCPPDQPNPLAILREVNFSRLYFTWPVTGDCYENGLILVLRDAPWATSDYIYRSFTALLIGTVSNGFSEYGCLTIS